MRLSIAIAFCFLHLVMILTGTPTAAQQSEWTVQWGTSSFDRSNDIAMDNAGNVYLVGETLGSMSISPRGSWDIYVTKYDLGGTRQWIRQFGSSSADFGAAVAVSDAGDVYLAGRTRGSFDINNLGADDILLRKYDSDGDEVWTRQFGTSGFDSASDIAVDGAGNVYVVGSMDSGTGGINDTAEAFVTRYDSQGNHAWTEDFGTHQADVAYGVDADANGNIVVTGVTQGRLGDTSFGNLDAFVAKFAPNGNRLWLEQLGTSGNDYARDVATDGNGNIFIAGETEAALHSPNLGAFDIFVNGYDPNGNFTWGEQYGTPENDGTTGLDATESGVAYLTGFTNGELAVPNAGDEDFFLSKFVNGSAVWTIQDGTDDYDLTGDTIADEHGNIWVAGSTDGDLGRTNAGSRDYFLSRVTDGVSPLDFNEDGLCNVLDLNQLLTAGDVAAGFDAMGNEPLDLNADGVIDIDDMNQWLAAAAIANGLTSAYLPGDANLDGFVDVSDLNLWNANKFGFSRQWDQGNFNGDGFVDISDLNLWNTHKFSGGALTAVPEPEMPGGLMLLLSSVWWRRRS